ncbi:heparan-alpha-glucosaminide N-acetyltransferase domain-containing protein, partial [uncultured Muriicola sp.]|uniref:heparan-alpha-glucosaminide N-acetyltransferase domain-containing protein n=1 Tax=uncultured Muriicola sp. TaxID=1583102 RepID=UPI002610ACEF
MEVKTKRLHFIDAMRAWAILMMLQGHFVDGLLDPFFRDTSSSVYSLWLYFRGITAPVFFTVSGFIFTYLLIRVPQLGFDNPRIRKGIKRGLELLVIGYLLRLNLFGLLKGELYNAFFLVDVLHCIGISIMVIIAVFLLTSRQKTWVMPTALLGITLTLFLFEPIYSEWTFSWLPEMFANYFTRANGSVFTIIPWVGYTAFGAFLSVLFKKYTSHSNLYPTAIGLSAIVGISLLYLSSPLFASLSELGGISLFNEIALNNYLFIRLGDVLIVFALFMVFRHYLTQPNLLRIGQNTLSIYVIHFVILYGSFTGQGLYRFFDHSL